ncbi:hypothetical protein ACQP1O_32030 [Nocardia sp. CA-151230]|uniref:hypothetical protein n=1 Tax=Nocardia sp. CA-151230 TaxID=3239982 RepID=UPI003D8F2C6F
MKAMAAPATAASIPGFDSVSRRVREFVARQLLPSRESDQRMLARTPLAILGPAPLPHQR